MRKQEKRIESNSEERISARKQKKKKHTKKKNEKVPMEGNIMLVLSCNSCVYIENTNETEK
jgi:hypothetical protein